MSRFILFINVFADMTAVFYTILATMSSVICIPQKPCNRIKIEEIWYEREILLADLGKPYNLNVHKITNTLFFSYTVVDSYSDVDFQLAFYRTDNREYQTIAGIRGGCAITIDQENDDVYLGGSHGIYKYNMVTKIADFYKEEGVNIWSLFHKRNLFYISYPDQKLNMEIDGKFAVVREFQNIEIDHFHINNDNIIYFANKTGLYKFDNAKRFVEVINDLLNVRQITDDNDGVMYFCTSVGIFKYDKNYNSFKKVLEIKDIQGLAFDNDNHFILSDEKSIMKLVKSNTGCSEVDDDHW